MNKKKHYWIIVCELMHPVRYKAIKIDGEYTKILTEGTFEIIDQMDSCSTLTKARESIPNDGAMYIRDTKYLKDPP